ncbi:MAG: Ni/Fe hydrogenase subunit alpha [Firmicutes bacterium HGW-Firmicutes-14]|nr:MAG: Ni/Fe hydrogenase subunit alpha [Firmicutes bacterium HGW-Firmicutes-14]
MARIITIDPVTKVEGHGKVTIHLDDNGNVAESHFHIQEFRGFEKFCEGRMVWEMPVITTRICGICPVSHHLASAKACDDLFGVEIPPAAKKLRELMHMSQMIHSHALHFFYLAAPDLLFGLEAPPEQRNVIGVLNANPDLGKKAIRLRQIGQASIEKVGGRSIHPVATIPGGMSKPLSHEDRYIMLKEMDEALDLAKLALGAVKDVNEKYMDLIPKFASFKTNYMGLVKDGALELYDGSLCIKDENGQILEEFDPRDYLNYIAEHTEDWTYLKFPYYKKQGWPAGVYRVAPLGRLNVADRISTPLANTELALFKKLGGGKPVQDSLCYHYARIIELLYAVERAKELLQDDEIVSREVRVPVSRMAGEGVGVIEAPRGTLIHHYQADDMGKLEKVNIIVSTAHNYSSMDKAVNEVAKLVLKNNKAEEPLLNQVEMAIRCYDPCLSCATHRIGKMPLLIQVLAPDGDIVRTVRREE